MVERPGGNDQSDCDGLVTHSTVVGVRRGLGRTWLGASRAEHLDRFQESRDRPKTRSRGAELWKCEAASDWSRIPS